MSRYRRAKHGGSYFFTVVTYRRQPILCLDVSRVVLREVFQEAMELNPFTMEAVVLLPDHLHCIWDLSRGDLDYPARWGWIKKEFSKRLRERLRMQAGPCRPDVLAGENGGEVQTMGAGAGSKGVVGTAHPTVVEVGGGDARVGTAHPTVPGYGHDGARRVGCAHRVVIAGCELDSARVTPASVPVAIHQVGHARLLVMVEGRFGATRSRRRKGEATVWQRRYWEHMIRDEADFALHCDYIHYNPVKHGLVRRVADWPYSTFHRFVRQGIYPVAWGGQVLKFPPDMGGE